MKGTSGLDGKRGISIQGRPASGDPKAGGGPAGEKGSVIEGLGLNSIDVFSNHVAQHRTVHLRRPVIIIEQAVFVFQRVRA